LNHGRLARVPAQQTGHSKMSINPAVLALMQDESGQNLVEYALLAGMVAIGATLVLSAFNNQVSSVFNSLGNSLTASS
jgi:pilus assembly protein Flp/PilA